MIRNVAIQVHPRKPEAAAAAKKLRRLLAGKAAVVPLSKAEILFVLGGDGMILSAAPAAAVSGVPMVGVNVGRLGFLAECSESNFELAVPYILSEKYRVEERRMLEVWDISSRIRRRKLGTALNEMLLIREGLGRIVEMSVSIGGESSGLFNADGVMISTPTGSTGHALAAGGPVISPSLPAFLIVPICPHPPRVRPMVVDEEDIEVGWTGRYRDLRVSLDGRRTYHLSPGPKSILVRPSPDVARFVRLKRRHAPSFYNIVRQKLI